MKLLQLGTNGVEEVDVAVGGGGSTAFVSTLLIAASNGQSNFVVSYTPGYTLCFLNGASFVEYTQTSGTSIVLDAAVAAKIVIGDELLVVAFNTLAIGIASDSDKLDGFDSSYFATAAAMAAAPKRQMTVTKTLTGTSVDFSPADSSGPPSWATSCLINIAGESTNGAAALLIQLGSGANQTSGYSSVGTSLAGTVGVLTSTAGLVIGSGSGANSSHSGSCTIGLVGGFTYSGNGLLSDLANSCQRSGAGSVILAGVLDRIRITTSNGTDIFDAGTVSIIYEG